MDTGIFKNSRRINFLRRSYNTDHIIVQLHDTGRFRIIGVQSGDSAAKIQISLTIIIHQDGRVKKPRHAGCRDIRNTSVDERLAERIMERTDRGIPYQHTDPGCIVREIQEELVLAVDIFPGNGRRPSIVRPCRSSNLLPNRYPAVIGPVHHIG
ncbi:hypothetical protein D3C73_1124700 [compost metagenome]